MAFVPERCGIVGIPFGELDLATAMEICQKISDYLGECAAVFENKDQQRYEIHIPVGDVTRPGLICFCTGLSDNPDPAAVIENNAGNQQEVADANPIGPVRSNQRARTIRDRRYNHSHPLNHIPRPRNSWIIYRSDKTRELRDMDPSLTAADISRITSRLWAEELPHIKVQYQQMAQVEANAHMAMYPDYRYRARRSIPRHPKVDSPMFWDSLPGADAKKNNEARRS